MRPINRTNGGFVVLCRFLTLPTNGSSLVSRSSAFVGPANSRSPQPTIRCAEQRHNLDVLFSSTTDQQYGGAADSVGSASTSGPKALGTSGDWSAYLDESKGLIYYFNPSTGESKWEAPEDTEFSSVLMKISAAKKVEMRERLKTYLEERLSDSTTDFIGGMQDDRREMEWKRKEAGEKLRMKKSKLVSSTTKNVPTKEGTGSNRDIVPDIVSEWKEWQALIDKTRGEIYYYNKRTRESSWERPVGFPDFKLSASKRIALEAQSKRYLEWHKDTAKVNVPGRESTAISDLGVNDGLEAAVVEAKAENSNKIPEPVKVATDYEVPEPASEAKPNSLPIVQQGDWSAYFDIKSGVVFYFNEVTSETSWDPPFQDFPRIVMENTTPKVLDSGYGNISMERALGYIGVDEMAEALAWEEAKKKERARKAAKRAAEAKIEAEETAVSASEVGAVKIYEAVKSAELERLEQEKKLAEEKKAREEAPAKLTEEEKVRLENERLKRERIAAEYAAANEREAAAKLAIEEMLEQERLERERLESERLEKKRLEAEQNITSQSEVTQPVLPKDDPTFTVESVETMVAPLKTRTLYDILQCSTAASRTEIKRSYLSLAKETHPDALLQIGMANNDETERKFVEISQAWKILGDPTSRRRYDRELQARGISSVAGNMFESWVMGAAKAMDEALAKAENGLESGGGTTP